MTVLQVKYASYFCYPKKYKIYFSSSCYFGVQNYNDGFTYSNFLIYNHSGELVILENIPL